MIEPLTENAPLPSMSTLYRRDLHSTSEEERQLLEIPFRVAHAFCARYPKLWPFVMDFVQEGNLQLIKALANRDPTWTEAEFAGYVGKSAKGAIHNYLTRTFDIRIPPTTRFHKLQEADKHERANLKKLEHHWSWETLWKSTAAQIHTPQSFNTTTGIIKQVEALLAQLPSRERDAIRLYYGINSQPHTTIEISTILNVSTRHAKALVNAAVKRLSATGKKPSSRELQTNERNKRMHQTYLDWLVQGRNFTVRDFAREVKCNTHVANSFLKERGVVRTYTPKQSSLHV